MPVWERYQQQFSLSTAGSHLNREIIHNQQADENFESLQLTIIDGVITVVSDTDDLVGLRLLICPEGLVDGDLSEDYPPPHDPMVYYSWFWSRGTAAFRLRSKKTIPPEHKLWLQAWKALGSTATTFNAGVLLYFAAQHNW